MFRVSGNKASLKLAEEMAASHGLPVPSNSSNKKTNGNVYHLVGAIFHVGSSSTCGHYIASIKPSKNASWKDFNDTNVKNSALINTSAVSEKTGVKKETKSKSGPGRPKKKDIDDGLNGKPAVEVKEKSTENKSCFSSSDAYVLVYVSEDYLDQYFCINDERKTPSPVDFATKEEVVQKTVGDVDRLSAKNGDIVSSLSDASQEHEIRERSKKSPSPNDLKNQQSKVSVNFDSTETSSNSSRSVKRNAETRQLEDMGTDLEVFVLKENEDFLEKNKKEAQDEIDGVKFLTEFVQQLENQDGYEGPHGYIPSKCFDNIPSLFFNIETYYFYSLHAINKLLIMKVGMKDLKKS